MGFIVHGPSKWCCASNIDDGAGATYDIFALARELGVPSPQLNRLSDRFYESTTIPYDTGAVAALHSEVLTLRDAYRNAREPQRLFERRVRATDPPTRERILERVIQSDPTYAALEELREVIEEAITAASDLRCVGD